MRKPQSDEEKMRELKNLEYRQKYLDPKQHVRLQELQAWYLEYEKSLIEPFRKWAFHPVHGGKIFEDEDEWNDAIKNGWYDALWKANKAKSAEGRQKLIEQEFSEQVQEQKHEDHSEFLVFLKRSMQKESGLKMLYYYTTEELVEAYKKLGLEVDESDLAGTRSRVRLYQRLKNHIELNT